MPLAAEEVKADCTGAYVALGVVIPVLVIIIIILAVCLWQGN